MTKDRMKQLSEGDIVQNTSSGQGYIVISNSANHIVNHIVAIRTITITNPSEWTIIRESNKEATHEKHEKLD